MHNRKELTARILKMMEAARDELVSIKAAELGQVFGVVRTQAPNRQSNIRTPITTRTLRTHNNGTL